MSSYEYAIAVKRNGGSPMVMSRMLGQLTLGQVVEEVKLLNRSRAGDDTSEYVAVFRNVTEWMEVSDQLS